MRNRSAFVASVLLATALVGAALPANAGAAQAESVPSGTSKAQLGLVGAYPNPTFALEFGLAVSQSAMEGDVGQSSSAYVDYGVATLLGAALGDLPTFQKAGLPKQSLPLLKLPEPASADSRATQAVDRVPQLPHFEAFEGQLDPRAQPAPKIVRDAIAALPTAFDENIDAGRETAQAGSDASSSKTRFNVMKIPGILTYGPGYTETSTTLDETKAHSYAEELKLGPWVSFKDLEWRSGQIMGEEPTGSFTYSSAKIRGKTYGPDQLPELQAAAGRLSESLDAWGIDIAMPEVKPTEGGGIEVTPLSFQFKDAKLLGQVLGGPYQALLGSDVNDMLARAQQALPEAGLAILVANVVIGIATGYGGLKLQSGGVSSSIGMKELEQAPDSSGAPPRQVAASSSSGLSWALFLGVGLALAAVALFDFRRLRGAFGVGSRRGARP